MILKTQIKKHRRFIFVSILCTALSTVAILFQNCGQGFESMNSKALSSAGGPNQNSDGDQLPAPAAPTPKLGLVVANSTAKQGLDLNFEIKITAQTQPVTINYQAINGTAVKATDYVDTVGTATILAGQTSMTVKVPTIISNNQTLDKNLSFSVTGIMAAVSENQMGQGQIIALAEIAKFKKVALGYNHSCAITPQDTVKCWGSNAYGELGNNTKVASSVPVDVVGLLGIKAISSGSTHSCAITAQDTVKCWGNNNFGQLGNNTPISSIGASMVPVDVAGLTGVKAISLGYFHSCAITAQDTVKCWGYNIEGQLGSTSVAASSLALDVPGLTGIKSISLGNMHACAITAQDTVKCWGNNGSGRLGNNSVVNSSSPVDVTGLTGIKAISLGLVHSCAITAQNTVKCWGDNAAGQLGNNTTLNSPVAIDVTGVAAIKSISIGGTYSCAITAQDTVKCWGFNGAGQLGNNSTINSSVAVDVTGLTGIRAISSGSFHACAVTAQDTLKCWGSNSAGQLATNLPTASLVPIDVITWRP